MTEVAGRETDISGQRSPRIDFILPYLNGGQRILDIGCNTGWLLDMVDCKEKAGIDYDGTFAEVVTAKGYQFARGYSWNIGAEDCSYDRIHFGQVIAHMREDLGMKSLLEIHRVLAPGGIAVISTVCGPAFVCGLLYALDPTKLVSSELSWMHYMEWEPNDLMVVIKQIGFKVKTFTIVPQVYPDSEHYKSNRFVQIFVVQKKVQQDAEQKQK